MTLQAKLGLRYAAIVGGCLLLLSGLAYHEFIVEPRVRKKMGIPKPADTDFGEYAEVLFHATIPVVLGVGWWFMRRTLTPINQLTRRIEQVNADNLDAPLPRSYSGDEVDRLTQAFNEANSRLHQAFQQIREFTLHASHELKTPLTVMRAQIETALRNPHPDTAASRDWMADHLDEIQRLARLVDDLTLLTKTDAGAQAFSCTPLPLADVVRELHEETQILAEPRGIHVSLPECVPATVSADRHRLRQLFLNLVDNAVKYSTPGSQVLIALRREGQKAVVRITNSGLRIPPDLKDRIFDRFVRGEEARRQCPEGTGLGLAICRAIARAHGGSLTVETGPDGFTVAAVEFPAGGPERERER